MGIYRKISTRIWMDTGFRKLKTKEKLNILYQITINNAPIEFAEFVGPEFMEADEFSHRQDLSNVKWRKTRLEIINEYGAVCHYCGIDCSDHPTIDHIKPVARGGTSEKHNLVVSCKSCNSRKGCKEEWVYEPV